MSEGEGFDAIKALGEEIQGVSNILNTLTAETRQAEMRAAEAATHYDNMVKLQAFAQGELARKRRVLSQLIRERDEVSKS